MRLTWRGKAFDLKAVVLRFALGPFLAAGLDLLAGLLLVLAALEARVVGRESDSAARLRVPGGELACVRQKMGGKLAGHG